MSDTTETKSMKDLMAPLPDKCTENVFLFIAETAADQKTLFDIDKASIISYVSRIANDFGIETTCFSVGVDNTEDMFTCLQSLEAKGMRKLIVHYSGQGQNSAWGSNSHFPTYSYVRKREYKQMSQSNLTKMLLKYIAKARLILTIFDCYNQNLPNQRNVKSNPQLYHHLFQYIGVGLISSARRGQYATFDNDLGGYFTHYFYRNFMSDIPATLDLYATVLKVSPIYARSNLHVEQFGEDQYRLTMPTSAHVADPDKHEIL